MPPSRCMPRCPKPQSRPAPRSLFGGRIYPFDTSLAPARNTCTPTTGDGEDDAPRQCPRPSAAPTRDSITTPADGFPRDEDERFQPGTQGGRDRLPTACCNLATPFQTHKRRRIEALRWSPVSAVASSYSKRATEPSPSGRQPRADNQVVAGNGSFVTAIC